MKPFVILYATREGQTRRIAQHIAKILRERRQTVRLRNVREIDEPFTLDRYEGAIVAASVHVGKHEPEMVEFVRRHRDELEALKTAFISVSLSEAGAEDASRPAEDRAKSAADVQGMIDKFLADTGWRPQRIKAVAGALLYTKYNFLVRFVMKQISKKSSGPTDTSRDYELTDWKALDRFVDELLSDRTEHARLDRSIAGLSP
jgi:menaquinone-dependent protoporphyrinogen oxidase